MKSKRFQIFAILLAFCFGVTINYSCGDNYLDVGDVVDNHKSPSSSSSSSNSNGSFQIDGLWFGRHGFPEGMAKEQTVQTYLNGTLNSSSTLKYTYDDYGRCIKSTYNDGTSSIVSTYQYNGKTVKSMQTYEYANGTTTTISTTTYIN